MENPTGGVGIPMTELVVIPMTELVVIPSLDDTAVEGSNLADSPGGSTQNLDGKLGHLVGLGDLVEFVGLVDDLAGPVDLADTGDRAAPVDFDPGGLDPGDLD